MLMSLIRLMLSLTTGWLEKKERREKEVVWRKGTCSLAVSSNRFCLRYDVHSRLLDVTVLDVCRSLSNLRNVHYDGNDVFRSTPHR